MRNRIKLRLMCAFFAVLVMSATLEAGDLKTFPKATYPQDIVITGVEPNVLFLLDTGSPMVFSPNGIMPLETDGRTPAQRNILLAECLYGSGARPFSVNGTENTSVAHSGYDRFGREPLSGSGNFNNIIGNPDYYYTPYDGTYIPGVASPSAAALALPANRRPYFLTFKNGTTANWNGLGTAPGLSANLLPYLPGGTEAGKSPSIHGNAAVQSAAAAALVPNDSRMYMMKLVLWRLTSPENQEMLSKMKVAMATSYQEENYGFTSVIADFYKTSPFRPSAYGVFSNGTAPTWSIGSGNGLGDYANGGSTDTYAMSQTAFVGVMRDYYDYGSTTGQWRQVNRSVLKVPFDKFYQLESDGTYRRTPHLYTFRQYIDGVEDASGATLNNPELFADGQTPLATSIHGRSYQTNLRDSQNQFLIQYAPRTVNYPVGGITSRLILREFLSTANTEGLVTGQAAGSIIDFFSPLSSFSRENGLNFSYTNASNPGTAGYFPVTGSCQSNWVIIFTAGNDESPGAHAPWEAAQKLFNDTLTMRGREFNKTTNKWEEKLFDMDSGVRTIVVGFVSPDAMDANSVSLRNSLTRIAQYGDPTEVGGSFVFPNTAAKPYFANDVPSLIDSLMAVLKRVFADKMASGSPVILPMSDLGADRALFASSYSINTLDQWSGWFRKYRLVSADNTMELWEAGSLMGAKGNTRSLYTTTTLEETPGAISSELVKNLTNTQMTTLTGVTSNIADFRNWLLTYEDIGPLGDMAHSGMTIIGRPDAASLKAQPLVNGRDKKVYIQTNRGVLHAIDFETGDETWGFIPPNIFQYRVKPLKFGEANTWMTGNGSTSMRSEPAALLDGLLAARDVKFSDATDHTVLVGCLGWGGNGLYAMDVTKVNSTDIPSLTPKFLWAIDNARYESMDVVPMNNVKRWGNAVQPTTKDYNYSDLGLTMQAFVPVHTAGGEDIGILPGGLGYRLGEDSQGKAFYFIDLETGEILKRIDSTSSASDFDADKPLGMGITPITYIEDSARKTTDIYTADSEGNVLHCKTNDPVIDWKMKGVFKLRTYAEPATVKTTYVSADLPVATPLGLLTAKTLSETWIFGGTADLMAPGERKLMNAQQFIFGVALSRLTGNEAITDLKRWQYFEDDIMPAYGVPYDEDVNVVTTTDKGWFLRLRPKMTDTTNPRDAEYATTDPFLYDNRLFIATFVPRTRQVTDSEKCPELGDSKLYVLDPITGKSILTDRQAVTMRNIKISGITALDNDIYMGVQQLKGGALHDVVSDSASDPDIRSASAIAGDTVLSLHFDMPPPPAINITPNVPHIQYWRELIRR